MPAADRTMTKDDILDVLKAVRQDLSDVLHAHFDGWDPAYQRLIKDKSLLLGVAQFLEGVETDHKMTDVLWEGCVEFQAQQPKLPERGE